MSDLQPPMANPDIDLRGQGFDASAYTNPEAADGSDRGLGELMSKLTHDVGDPLIGTPEYKTSAVRVEPLAPTA